MRRFENPYKPLEPARGINFAGREDIIRVFRQRIGAEPTMGEVDNRHLLLIGVGGIGKTSLLLRLQDEFGQAYPRLTKRAVYLNLRNYSADAAGLITDLRDALPRPRARRSKIMTFFGLSPTASLEDLREKLREDYVQSVSFTFPVPGWEFTPGILLRPRPAREGIAKQLARVFKELSLLTMEAGKPTLILMDDAGTANEIPGGHRLIHSLSCLMDASVQAKNRNLLLVLAARPERKGQLEHEFRVELFDPGYIKRLPVYPLTREETRQAVIKPAEQAGVHLSDQMVSDLVDSAGGHPYFLQIACSHLWDYLVAEDKLDRQPIEVDADTIATIVRQGQAKLFEGFNSDEQYLLKVLACAPRPMSAMEIKQIVQMEGKGDLIDVDSTLESLLTHKHRPITARDQRDQFAFTHDIFRDHIADHQLDAEERQVAAIQAALDGMVRASEAGGEVSRKFFLDSPALDSCWQHRHRLAITSQHLEFLVHSDLHARLPFAWTWAASPEALDHLLSGLTGGDAHLRLAAAEALREFGESAVEGLADALQHEDPPVRLAAVKLLENIRGAKPVEHLCRAVRDHDTEVGKAAALALGRIGGAQAVAAVAHAVRHGDGPVRLCAVQALSMIRGPETIEPLVDALRDEDGHVRQEAASALGNVGEARVVKPLVDALGDGTAGVRREVAWALGKIGDVRAVEPLIDALGDGTARVRRAVAWALGKIGDVRAVEPLIDALGDGTARVRRQVARALGKIGDVRAVEPLIGLLYDEDRDVRMAAVRALGKIGDSRALSHLERLARGDEGGSGLFYTEGDEARDAICHIKRRQHDKEQQAGG